MQAVDVDGGSLGIGIAGLLRTLGANDLLEGATQPSYVLGRAAPFATSVDHASSTEEFLATVQAALGDRNDSAPRALSSLKSSVSDSYSSLPNLEVVEM